MAANSSSVFDVAIVGSGPAGASSALALARHGARVVLLEKAILPRHKTCGGGLVNRARQLLPTDVRFESERCCHIAELNFLKQGLHFATKRSAPIIFMTMRAEFDHALALAAERAGATLRQACPVKSVRCLGDGVELGTDRDSVRARFVIAADGANSLTAKQTGWPGFGRLIPALECEVFVNESDFARLNQTARFDFEVIPEGYAWVFPKKEHLSVGVLSMRRGRVDLHEYLARYLAVLGITTPQKMERHGYVIPIGSRRGGVARGRILLVGDAAGLVDPVTAEGITYAIQSGQLAARTLLDCAFDAGRCAPYYQTLVAKEISLELQAGRALSWLLYRRPRLASWVLRRHGTALSELVTDIVMGRTTYRGALRKPIHYLRLLFAPKPLASAGV